MSITVLCCLLFVNGCATNKTAENVSLEPPPAPNELKITEFILGAGDTIEVTVYRNDDLKRTIQINNSGIITYPLVGDVKAAGLGVLQLRDKIRDGLLKYITDPQVSVSVTSIRSQKFSVLGEVKTPGIFSLEGPVNLLEAMARAGGFTPDAEQGSILLIRGGMGKPQLMKFDVEKSIENGDITQLANLQTGDIVYVPATHIADVSRYFEHLSRIIAPILSLETGYFIGQQIEGGAGSTAVAP